MFLALLAVAVLAVVLFSIEGSSSVSAPESGDSSLVLENARSDRAANQHNPHCRQPSPG